MVLTDKRWQKIQQRRAAWAHAIERSALARNNDERVAALAKLRAERDRGELPDYDDLEALYLAIEVYRPIVEAIAEYDNINPWGQAQWICGICEGTGVPDEYGVIDAESPIEHAAECPVRLARRALALPETATDGSEPPTEAGT